MVEKLNQVELMPDVEIPQWESIEWVETYEDKIFKWIDIYEDKLYQMFGIWQELVYSFIYFLELIFIALTSIGDSVYYIGRYITFPLHWVWIFLWDWLNKKEFDFMGLPFNEIGTHFWYGPPGVGKSTVIYHKNLERGHHTGKAAYTTVQMEEPRTDLDGSEYYLNQVFDPSDMFQNGEQMYSWDPNFDVIVYEEVLTKYNQRNNSEKTYKDEVLPMIAAMGTQRHQDIEIFDFISQIPTIDIQIVLMLVGYHVPRIRKVFDYANWLKTGQFRFKIAGWHIESYKIIPLGGNNYKLSDKPRKYFYPCTLQDEMQYFKRLNMKDAFKSKPKLIAKEMFA